jgi:SAM-dependent methyltransferase
VQVVQGTAHSSGLEQLQLDKVIIRNALHHFSAIPDMLQSVKESLGPGGKLLLKESFPDLCGEGCCEDLLSEERLLEVLREAGFRLESEQLLIDPEGFTWKLLCLGTGDS